ncbi:hypothetical protein E4P54_16480 [Salmonella enterica subsp. enterica serovar Panama]|uniref:hypothetical protein n=1 Tax=Enterobacteriaceae TaxID=543 RepID=UPI0014739361|nr:hypothetical protein [Salmonella enterica]EGO0259853.1 hypothetical protein [Salmonella enterica subsp. enterica serovar Panama]EGP7450133.1 hypothetical protein [Salmonella enterica subsp. enterica serovar Panama]NMF70698.1 hypothetical protein [Salmonella enterica subsp. enterica serovar Panama]NMF75422.1 hypothetical protein [Salmonella enterica subsp. enterica serovar Panama]NMF80147.1 hypothetical protein [Salmonella enterica subsp. enterica serovar Panama]
MLMKRLFISCILVISFPSFSDEINNINCHSEDTIEYVFSHYSFVEIDENDKTTKQLSKEDTCNNPILNKIISGLEFIKKTKKATIPKKYITPITQEGALLFFNKRIKTIKLENSEESHCESLSMAFVSETDRENNAMHVCNSVKELTPLVIASFLLHESRHIDGFPHQLCNHGRLLDTEKEGCDIDFKSFGAYAIQLSYFYQIYYGKYNTEIKNEARNYIFELSLERFNTPLPGYIKGGLILDDEDSFSFYDGKEETQFVIFNDKTSAMALDGIYPVIFFKNGNITKYDFTREWKLRTGPMQDNYKKLSKDEMNSVLDVFLSRTEYCFLMPLLIKCTTPKGQDLVSMSLKTIQASRFWNPTAYYMNDIRVVGIDGKIHFLPASIIFNEYDES